MLKKILIIDDDFDDLENMKNILEKEDFEVKVVTNGAAAMDIIEEELFDLILVDIQMPTLSGFDLVRLMKDRIKGIKLAYVSIMPEKEVDLNSVDGFIQKPFSEKKFLEKIKKILEKTR